ncbi:uncharacterized protein LOC143624884 [Bidens hawaiensis]|uniref:uncharacterized protein LOC143624884 n=1 Tax=Bidens hawaiensis TaxID=980011 RepID=UPI00404B512C
MKDVQRLMGRIAALNRFISRYSEKCRNFYDILRKNKKFEWTQKHEDALKALKDYLSSTSAWMKPVDDEPLSLYLAISGNAIRVVLVKDHEGQQHPIYYKARDVSGLSSSAPMMYNTSLETAIKSQALADFVADFSSDLQKEVDLEVQQLEENKDPWILFTNGASMLEEQDWVY